ncbi:MAG: hypothetical protein ACI9X4_001343 [Glaciecola sp.]|jgi:hypothetical protein
MSRIPKWILPLLLGMGITSLLWWQSTLSDTVQGGWNPEAQAEQGFTPDDSQVSGLLPPQSESDSDSPGNRTSTSTPDPANASSTVRQAVRRSSLGPGAMLLPDDAGRLQVVLLDAATREPLPGIPVVAYLEDPPNGRPIPTRRTQGSRGRLDLTPLSGARGQVEFDLPPGYAVRLSIRPNSADHQPMIKRITPLAPLELRVLEVLVRGVTYTEFHGLVRDRTTSKPLYGTSIRVHSRDEFRAKPLEASSDHLLAARTDAQGFFEIDASEQGSFAWIQAPGFGPMLIGLDAAHQKRNSPREVYLTPAAFLAISLRDGQGKPLQEVEVQLRVPSSSLAQNESENLGGQSILWNSQTDRYGRVEFESLPSDAPITIEITAPGSGVVVPPPMQILNPGEARQVQWVIGGGTRLSGQLALDPDTANASLAGQEMWLLPASRAGSKLATAGDQGRALHKTHTDDLGQFVFSGVPSGAWWITPAAQGDRTRFAPIARRFEVPKDLPELNVTIEVFPALWVSGRIEPLDGKPPGLQRIWIRSTSMPGTLNGTTDEDGHFRLGPLPPGPAEIAVYAAQGHPGSAPQVCKAGAEDVRLTLRRSASIRALLSTADGSSPPNLERILLTHPDGQVTQVESLSIDDLPPGLYALSVLAIDGRTAWAQHIEARAGRSPGEAILELAESAQLTLTGPGEYSIWAESACVAKGDLEEGQSLLEPVPPGAVRLTLPRADSAAKQWKLKAGEKRAANLASPAR